MVLYSLGFLTKLYVVKLRRLASHLVFNFLKPDIRDKDMIVRSMLLLLHLAESKQVHEHLGTELERCALI